MASGSFGELLKREREMREVSLNEVTVATRIATRFLQALENEDWAKLPGGAFNRGFVRSIARYLGLNEETLLSEYDLARGENKGTPAPPAENRIPSPSKLLVVVAALLILVGVAGAIAGGLYSWRRYATHRAARRSVAAPVPSQSQSLAALPNLMVDAAPLPASSSLASPLDLSVSTSAATRIRIVADGKLLLDSALSAGETRHFSAGQRFEVTAADSSAVLLELNGRAMPALGAPGASGTIMLSQKDLGASPGGNSQP
jgi:cytoskeleton protein RodZ